MFEATFSTQMNGVTIIRKKDIPSLMHGVAFCRDEYASQFGVEAKPAELELLASHNVFSSAVSLPLDDDSSGYGVTYGFTWSVLDKNATEAEVVVEREDDEEVKPDPNDPVYLYVIARTDLESFTGTEDNRKAGLPCAQTGHAANQMVYEVRKKNVASLTREHAEWEAETGCGFGTEIVLGAHFSQLKQVIDTAKLLGLHANMTKDPEYPLRDGKTLHLIPLETCGFIFGRRNRIQPLLKTFDLLP